MSVKIDVELQSGDAIAEIEGIAAALGTLQAAGGDLGDIDLDFDGVDIDEISEMADELEDVSEQLDGLFEGFDGSNKDRLGLQSEVDEVEKRLENLDADIDLGRGKGETGGGGSSGNDPPSRGKSSDGDSEFDPDRFKKKLADLIGIDDSDVSLTGDFDPKRLGKDGGSILPSLRGLTSDEYPHVKDESYPDLHNVPDSLFGTQDPSEMDWDELQKAAGDAGVYTRPRDVPDSVKSQDDYSFRSFIEDRFRSSQPGTGGIQIDTAQGKKNLREAMKTMQTPLTDSGAIDDSGSMRKAFAEDIAEQRGYDSLRDLAAADRHVQNVQSENDLHEQARLEKKSRDLRDRYNERRDLEEEREKAQQRVEIAEIHEEARSIRERAATREQIAEDQEQAKLEKKSKELRERYKARRDLEEERQKARKRKEIGEIHETARRARKREQISEDQERARLEKKSQKLRERAKARRELENERQKARKRKEIGEIHEKARRRQENFKQQQNRRQMLDASHMAAFDERKQKKAVERAKARRDLIEERAAARKRVQVDRDHEVALRKKKGRDFLKPSNIKNRLANLGDSSSGIAKRLRQLVPSMGMIYNAVAAMLPALIALGVQLLGVASAMGAVAVAGGAIIGLGLLGHGDSMAESMQNAKLQMRELKNEMFAVAQPTMQEFAPIQEDIFEAIPGASEGIFEEMEGLTGFEGTLFDLGGMAAGGIEEFFAIINRNQGKISQLSKRFGGLAGSNLLGFFQFLINTGYKNQEMLIKLAATGKDLLTIIFNLSMVFGRVVSSLQPLFSVLSKLSVLLHSRLVVGLFSALAAMALFAVGFGKTAVAVWTLTSAVGSLLTFLGILSSGSLIGGMGAFFTTLSIYAEAAIAHLTALTGSALAAYAALSALTLGTFAVLGGIGLAAASGATSGMGEGGPSGSGGGGDTYNDNRTFEVYTDSSDDLASTKALAEQIDRSTATNRPDVGNNTTDGS